MSQFLLLRWYFRMAPVVPLALTMMPLEDLVKTPAALLL